MDIKISIPKRAISVSHIFFSKYLNANLKGLNTQSGVLSLSWNDFKEGFAIEDDKVNLGLHELAHALYIDLDEEGNYDEHFSAYFEKWEDIAMKDYLELKENKISNSDLQKISSEIKDGLVQGKENYKSA